MKDLATANFDDMTPAEFEEYLPELFAVGGGKVSEDPRFKKFLVSNPDCAALVHDLEAIAEHARSLFSPEGGVEPSDAVWSGIASKLKDAPPDGDEN